MYNYQARSRTVSLAVLVLFSSYGVLQKAEGQEEKVGIKPRIPQPRRSRQLEGQKEKVRVKLKGVGLEYLLGETVQLQVTVTNRSNDVIEAWQLFVKESDPEIRIYISKDGGKYTEYRVGIGGVGKRRRRTRVLKPSESWKYTLRMLYTYKDKGRLAFTNPGRYRIKVRYPLIQPAAPPDGRFKKEELESNAIRIRIKQPEGIDLKVWKQIQSPHFLYFLQSGYTKRHHEDDPLRAVEILKSFPKSRYADDLRWALKTYYDRDRRQAKRLWKLKEEEARKIREVTGITVPPPQPFPNDMRLAQMITYHFRRLTPLDDVLKVISRQSGVTLRLHPKLRVRRMKSIRVTEPLRKFMRNLSAYKAKWVPDGKDGYLLKPADGRDKKKKSQTAKNGAKK